MRSDRERQYVPLRAQVGVSHQSLIKVAELMEANIERTLSLERIAKETGLSRRQIERLFKRHLNCVPKRYYLELRLKRARELLLQTAMPIMDITTACGFQSPPHFSSATASSSATRRASSARHARAASRSRTAAPPSADAPAEGRAPAANAAWVVGMRLVPSFCRPPPRSRPVTIARPTQN